MSWRNWRRILRRFAGLPGRDLYNTANTFLEFGGHRFFCVGSEEGVEYLVTVYRGGIYGVVVLAGTCQDVAFDQRFQVLLKVWIGPG